VLPVRIGSCLKLVLRYEYLVLDTPHQAAVYLRQQECEDAWLLVEAKKRARKKKIGKKTGLNYKKPKRLLRNVPTCAVLNKD